MGLGFTDPFVATLNVEDGHFDGLFSWDQPKEDIVPTFETWGAVLLDNKDSQDG